MQRSDASRELRLHEPNVHIESEVHVARAKAMLNMPDDSRHEPDHRVVGKTIPTRKEPPTFTKPLQNIRVKEGQAIKSVTVSRQCRFTLERLLLALSRHLPSELFFFVFPTFVVHLLYFSIVFLQKFCE